ncbi:MAG: transcriptional repressor LexA [Ruminococcaceae bacterium]|nr:transcriptional repressor LexA [Oscillospiraceae bacterium]
MERPSLTEKQEKVYKIIVEYLAEGIPPTVREICRDANIKSTSTVHGILATLEDYGYITRNAGNSRGIRLMGGTPSAQVPVLGKVTAGNPILAVEQIEDYIPYPTRSADGLFALRVSGLSMRDAGILDGDLIIADKNLSSRGGDIVVAMIEDEATVKRLGFENGIPVLYPENPDFEPIRAERIDILGKVVGSFRQY